MPSPSKQTNSLDACDPALNATVSASAGSGKTWLLITRIVRLLIDGAEAGNIIALTFTRKAAGEMQIRLNERLFEMATASEKELEALLKMIGSDTGRQTRRIAAGLYEKLMNSLYPVRIQTFHSFCQDILARFPLEADIPPGFDLSEDSSLLERQAWQILFDEAQLGSRVKTGANHTVTDIDSKTLNQALDTIMQFCNGPDNTFSALNSFLSHRSDWWAYTRHTAKPVDFACDELEKSLRVDPALSVEDLCGAFFTESLQLRLQVFANLLREIKNKTSEKHAVTIDDTLSSPSSGSSGSSKRFAQIKTAFLKKDGGIMLQGRQHNATLEKKLGAEDTDHFLELHQQIADDILQVSEQIKRLLTFTINTAWYYAGHHFIEIFQQLKTDMRLLDFTDLEWKCYELLQHADNAHWVQYKIDQRIDHILIDEFQDTNPTQWHLLSPILEEIAANPEQRPRSVFLVGDEKQSIYSFRRANPALQAQASQWLAESLDARATPLDFSRRSSPAIIHCVNQIFEQDGIKVIMSGYTTHDTHLRELPGKVSLCELFQHEESDDDEDTEDEQAIYFRNPLLQPNQNTEKTLRHDEADYIARQILHLIENGEKITGSNGVRTVDYGDIMILMRNRTHLAIYEDTLKQFGIPFIGSKKGGLLENLEIQDLTCLLNFLITPYDNLALAQILKSPIFSASDEDLILLASQENKNYWYERLLSLSDEASANNNGVALSEALQKAITLLPRWQKLAEQLPVHDCLDRIFSEGNIVKRYMAANRTENMQKVAANCQRFLELSLETDSGRYPSITRFLQRLNHLQSHSGSPPEEPLTQSSESRVTLMTIHGSKGLESPVIFLADCNSTSSNRNAYSSLVRWPAEKAQPVNFQLQLSKENTDSITMKLQQDKLKEQAREELNLLYVALTRAREQLYISGVANSRSSENSWYQIIEQGLKDITETDDSIDGINARVYRHLRYNGSASSDVEVAVNVETGQTGNRTADNRTADIDHRLLKPIEKLPPSFFMIAPSMDTSAHTEINDASGLSEAELPDENTRETQQAARLAKWRGNTIHHLLEKLCGAAEYPATEDSIRSLAQQLKIQTERHQPDYLVYLEDCIEEAISTYNHAELKDIFQPAADDKTYNEMPLMFAQGQTDETQLKKPVYGIVDRIIRSKDEIFIIDYKSHQLDADGSLREAAAAFSSQLDYYREGVNRLWPGHKIKTGILFTHHKKMIWSE
ncbi:MAG: UvrD-helicase domain-containing protein [Proteobacteria bacterium]|nr:UvrD-helicase domain-containing protein [Pseudomonadota bacterium]